MRKGRIAALLIIVALVAGIGYRVYRLATAGKKETEPSDVREAIVKTALVEKGTIRRDISLTGDVEAMTSVQVFPKIPGRLIKLSVTRGDIELATEEGLSVQKDEIIAVVDHKDLDAQVAQAAAALDTANAQLTQAQVGLTQVEQDLERIRNLYKEGATSKQSLDKIEAEYKSLLAQRDVAKARVDQSQAALNQAQIQLAECYIRAPITGTISEKYLDEGDMAMLTRPIVAIIEVDKVKVTADLPERYLGHVREGTDASLGVDAFPNRLFQGTITKISPILSIVNRTAKLEITVANPDHALKPGMFARITLTIAKREGVPLIAEATVLRNPAAEITDVHSGYVFVVENGVARRRDVRLGLEEGPKVEILEGLQSGEIIVTAGQHNVRDGQRVRTQREASEKTQKQPGTSR